MRNYLIFFTLTTCAFFYACQQEEKVPDYVMSEDRFVEVLTEFQIAESVVRLSLHRTEDTLIYNDSIYNAVFRKLNIKQADFDSNYNYYLNSPEQFMEIYQKVIENLSSRSAELMGSEGKTEVPENPAQ